MTHFKEIIETVSKTTGISKRQLCFQLGITNQSLLVWQRTKPPDYIYPMIMHQLKEIVRRNCYEPTNQANRNTTRIMRKVSH